MKERRWIPIVAAVAAALAVIASGCGGETESSGTQESAVTEAALGTDAGTTVAAESTESTEAAATSEAVETGAEAGTETATPSADPLHAPLQCDASPTPEEVLAFEAPKANADYNITVMQVSLAAYSYQAVAWGAEEAAKDASGPDGTVTIQMTAGEGYTSPELQLQQAENVLQAGTDAIVLVPSDPRGAVPIVDAATEQGVPVVTILSEVESPDVYTVIQDDYLMGKKLADEINALVPDGGPGVFIAGPANATWSVKRANGFVDQVEAMYPNLEVVAAPTQLVDPGQALTDFVNAASREPDIKWLASVYYAMPLPDSLPERYRGIPYATTAYEPTSIEALESGALTSVLPVYSPSMGYVGVATAVALLNGDTPPKVTCLPFEPLSAEDIGTPVADGELYPSEFEAQAG